MPIQKGWQDDIIRWQKSPLRLVKNVFKTQKDNFNEALKKFLKNLQVDSEVNIAKKILFLYQLKMPLDKWNKETYH